jgi:hypothetical protein
MTSFQGDLKLRSSDDIDALAKSLLEEGLITPFAVWHSVEEDKLYLLDGHGRMQAIIQLAMSDPEVLTQAFPVNVIDAESEEEARKRLLQIISTYGKINKAGLIKFASPVLTYKAPALVKYTHNIVKAPLDGAVCDKIIVKLRIDREKAAELKALLKQVDGIEIV